MITAVPGVRVGHWTDPVALTGCTVVLLPPATTASGDIRGGAPGTREWALLDPRRTVDRIDAVVLTGGSAFGLAACDGVVRWCSERGIGYPTPAGPVPIVVGMVIYDLMVGDPAVRPGAGEGYEACEAAEAAAGPGLGGAGRVGAGAGATIGKWLGPDGPAPQPGGLGSAVAREGDLVVSALVVANGMGVPAGADAALPRVPWSPAVAPGPGSSDAALGATTIGVVVTNARLDKTGCLKVAEAGHDGLARAIDPVHTGADGDALVAAATGAVSAPVETVRALGAWVVEQAVLAAAASASASASART